MKKCLSCGKDCKYTFCSDDCMLKQMEKETKTPTDEQTVEFKSSTELVDYLSTPLPKSFRGKEDRNIKCIVGENP